MRKRKVSHHEPEPEQQLALEVEAAVGLNDGGDQLVLNDGDGGVRQLLRVHDEHAGESGDDMALNWGLQKNQSRMMRDSRNDFPFALCKIQFSTFS